MTPVPSPASRPGADPAGSPTDRPPTTAAAVLAEAARQALRAPSVLNTQPWRWRVGTEELELHADRERQLRTVDPAGRLLMLSCGAALHHVRCAIAAAGYGAWVRRLPDPGRPDLLARVRLTGPHPPSTDALMLGAAITTRHTDRRAYADYPVPAPLLALLGAAAEAEGVHLHLVGPEHLRLLAIAAAKAGATQFADPEYRGVLAEWTNRPQWSGDGVPAEAVVRPTLRRVPVRRLALDPRAGADSGAGHDRGATYAILFGATDGPADWLRAGEALSAVLLTAAGHGLAGTPMTDVVEVPAARRLLRPLLAGRGQPYLALRLGVAVPTPSGPPVTPRRPAQDAIEYPEPAYPEPAGAAPSAVDTAATGPVIRPATGPATRPADSPGPMSPPRSGAEPGAGSGITSGTGPGHGPGGRQGQDLRPDAPMSSGPEHRRGADVE